MFLAPALLLAQADDNAGMGLLVRHLLSAIAFAVVGILVLGGSFWLIKRLMPFSVTKEIEEDHNVALAIIIASVILGMSIIIAAAVVG